MHYFRRTERAALPRRLGTVAIAVLALFIFCTSAVSAFAAQNGSHSDAVVEIVYVKGCAGDSTPLRSTSRCFVGGQSVEHITLRGMHFPHNEDGSAPDLRVVFEESLLPSIFEDEPGYAGTSATAAKEKTAQLTCQSVAPSSLFPSQLLTCTLPRPSIEALEAEDEETRTDFLARARQYPVWMDAKLMWKGRLVSVLRRALEVDLTTPLKRATVTVQYGKDGSITVGASPTEESGEVGQHEADTKEAASPVLDTLERLYAPSQPGAPEADDIWRTELGVGGLKEELQQLYRRVFLSRLPSLTPITSALGLQHVRGVILYGPPGNGKTLVARGLVRLLGPNTRMTIVNAGDVLSKYVGESEKNLRDLFEGRELGATARQEDEDVEHGAHQPRSAAQDESSDPAAAAAAATPPLHVLIIDEFDALFRRRGHSEDESSAKAVFDGVTNALLSLMDGVKTRNDILVIGLTNRLDAVDEALLRPGRFEVLIEVPAPDQPAREEIFFIHTERLRQSDFLDSDVDLSHLAAQTAGFSGSDIAGVVRAATSYSLLRYRQNVVRDPSAAGTPDGASFHVTAREFAQAVREVRDSKRDNGAESASSWADERSDLVDHDGTLERSTQAVVNVTNRLRLSATPAQLPWLRFQSGEGDAAFGAAVSVFGAAGSGKTAVARHFVQSVPDVAGVHFLSGQRLAETPDMESSLSLVQQAFSSAAKSGGLNVVVIDDMDDLVARYRGHAYALTRLENMIRTFLHSRAVSPALSPQNDPVHRHADLFVKPDATQPGNEAARRNNTRLLILTFTKQNVIQGLNADLSVTLHLVARRGMRRALAHLHIVDDADSTLAVALADVYPTTLSYKDFLRVTQMALQSGAFAVDISNDSNGGNDGHGTPALVHDDDTATHFMTAVRDVVSSMGLYDPFQAWYNAAGKRIIRTPEELLEKAKKTASEAPDADGSELLW